ncbi:hypothetical protein [Methylomonas sp. AM2-LC]|uniref:efflux RND transporter periplasmic adaptor subunit n=1 Tax=Methylomonas sp. AM2-LC TaxID=3153301 RepID=UPI0032678E09
MRKYIIIAVFSIALQNSFAVSTWAADSQPDAPANTEAPDMLRLDLKSQQLAGIKTQPLISVQQQAELTTYGRVLSPEPLVQLRQQYLAALAHQNSAKARYNEAHLNLNRTENLHQQDIVSTRRLQEQQAQWQTDKANLDASIAQQNSILDTSRLEWGDILTDWFVRTADKTASSFLNHTAHLIQITLPANQQLPASVQTIAVDTHGQRASAIKATLISASPRIDALTQGQNYFFKATGRQMPVGAHITAWIASDAQQLSGVSVPKTALVWNMGQAYVYIKIGDQQFSRRALVSYTAGENDYFVTGTLAAGEEIVTTGAQTLLSQQLKAQIPDEDDD